MPEPIKYLDAEGFRARTVAPKTLLERVEVSHPGFTDATLKSLSAWINARLRKRYAVPFSTETPPETVCDWLTRLATRKFYLKRGLDPTDKTMTEIIKDAEDARAEITEAANSEDGWFDLPLVGDEPGTGISQGGPWGYSEASPYVGAEMADDTARSEDSSGYGSS